MIPIFKLNIFRLLHVFNYFVGVKLCKFKVLRNPCSSQHYDGSHYSLRCNIEFEHFAQEYTFNVPDTLLLHASENQFSLYVHKGGLKPESFFASEKYIETANTESMCSYQNTTS